MDDIGTLSDPASASASFAPRFCRALGLLLTAAAVHVWVVPVFHPGRALTLPAHPVIDARGIPVPPLPFDRPGAAPLPTPAAVRVRTAFIRVDDARPAAAARMRTADWREEAVGTAGSPSSRAVALEEPPAPDPARLDADAARNAQEEPAGIEADATPAADPGPSPSGILAALETPLHAAALPPAVVPAAIDRAAQLRRDEEVVRQVLQDYARAFERLDVQAAKAIWPTVDGRALQRAFQQLDAQQLRFASCGVAVSGRDANARCRGDATYRPKVGSRVVHLTAREWTFNLSRDNDRWQIVNATLQ